MAFEPSLVTLVPIATFQPSQAPRLWTFDDMDDMVELQDDPELYQASSQTPTVATGKYVTIINAYGHSRRTSETSSLSSLPEDCACSSGGNSSRTYSSTSTEEDSSSSSSRRSSSLSNDLVRTSSLDKVKRVLRKYVAKLKRPSSSIEPCFVTATACGPSQGCLVLSAQAMRATSKQWQQASIAMAGFTSWWKA